MDCSVVVGHHKYRVVVGETAEKDGFGRLLAEGVKRIAEKIGAPVAVKSQILAGGRGKAGGIKFAQTSQEAEKLAREMLGSEIRKYKVEKVLVERKIAHRIRLRHCEGQEYPHLCHGNGEIEDGGIGDPTRQCL
jgi:phosphoribosylamine-glycine ligase